MDLKGSIGHSHTSSAAFDLLQQLDPSDIEMTQWKDFPFSPDSLEQKMKTAPVQIPLSIVGDTPSEEPPKNERGPHDPFVHFHQMTIFSVNSLDDYPHHGFKQRLNFAASGSIESNVCRYSSSAVTAAQAGASSTENPQALLERQPQVRSNISGPKAAPNNEISGAGGDTPAPSGTSGSAH
jgi:hypothetical protein